MNGSRAAGAADRQRRLDELGQDLVRVAYLRGDFVLSSGKRSSYYFDKYLFETRPDILRRLASYMAEVIPPRTDRIAGTELGAVALATALSLETGIPFVVVRKGTKEYSTERLIEGELVPRDRVVLVEDIVTSGAQAIRAASGLGQAGAEVLRIVAVVDREEGGAEAIAAAGYSLSTLFSRTTLGL